MRVILATVQRTWAEAALWPIVVLAAGLAWLGRRLALEALGGGEEYAGEVQAGALLLAGAAVLSLAEPLVLAREARGGLLLLRAARCGGFGLAGRWAGLMLAMLPALALAVVAGGGLPPRPLGVALDLVVLVAGGLLLGSLLERTLLVPALWILLVAGHLRAWLEPAGVGWLLPAFGQLDGWDGALHAVLWACGALALARWRLAAVAGRGG